MDELVPLISRWVHVGTTIVLVGGSVFMRFVLGPAATQALSDDAHQALREKVVGTWKRFVHVGILLFVLSGFYNYIAVTMPSHKGDGLYHALMGTKIILAFVVFFIGEALVGKSEGLKKIRDNRQKWLLILVVLAALIVGIAGFLKIRGKSAAAETGASPSQSSLMICERAEEAWRFTRSS